MSGRIFRDPSREAMRGVAVSIVAVAMLAAVPDPGVRAMTPHTKSEAKLTSTLRTEFKILKEDKKVGSEIIEKKVFDNNTVVFTIDATMTYGEGVLMAQHIELVVEEESFFPRSLKVKKTVTQREKESFDHEFNVEMFANLAVVTSMLGGQAGSRRIVVPTGTAITDVGVLGYLYQTLFWYDSELGGKQRFEYLDPTAVAVQGGELTMDGEETIAVLGKKTKVSVFNLQREKLGPATLWVDGDGTIVRGEQNFMKYELVSKKNS